MRLKVVSIAVAAITAGCIQTICGADLLSSTPNSVIKLPEEGRYSFVHAGDVNTDGKQDLVVCAYANGASQGAVYIYYQKNGKFGSKPDFSLKIKEPRGAVIKDIDGDGKNDIVINSYRKRIYICYAKKDFNPIEYCDTNMRANDLLNVNLNKNLKISTSLLGKAVWWRVGLDGIVRQTYIARAPKNNSALPAAGDLNSDENIDLVYPQPNRLLLYYGPFTPLNILRPKDLSQYSIIKQTKGFGAFKSVCVADCNGDAKADIVALSKSGILFYNQNSPMGFTDKISASLTGDFWAIKMTDINGDKLEDIVAIDSNLKKIRVFLQKKDGGFTNTLKDADQIISGKKFYKLALTDINGDGKIDLISSTAKNSVVIYYNITQ